MGLFNKLANGFKTGLAILPKEESFDASLNINFKIVVVEFSDFVESHNGKKLANILGNKEGLNVSYFDKHFSKTFLNLESRSLFDLIDKGQEILEKTNSDVLVWGYREDDRIRLNFQTSLQYEKEDTSFISLLDSLYFPASALSDESVFPLAISNLIYGAIVSSLNITNKEQKIQKHYLLKKIITKLSSDNSAKTLSIDYLPYIMNFLGIIYLSYCRDRKDVKDYKIVNNLLKTAIKHQDLIKNPIHLGCVYYHIAQLNDCAALNLSKNVISYYKNAVSYYQQAQKYLSKYNYPYDYGYISYKLSHVFYNYWRQKDEGQTLRDAIFQLREAEKVFTFALFPDFWSNIQGELGQMLGILGGSTKNDDISNLAITSFKNQQKVISEKRNPLLWASIQERIGDIHYRLGKNNDSHAMLEDALEYFHDALYIYDNISNNEDTKRLTTSIAKASQMLSYLE